MMLDWFVSHHFEIKPQEGFADAKLMGSHVLTVLNKRAGKNKLQENVTNISLVCQLEKRCRFGQPDLEENEIV